MTDTFVPPKCPVVGTSDAMVAKVRSASFGDGYSQRAKDGLNALGRTISISWDGLTRAQAQTIEDFFVAKGGSEAFLYQPLTISELLKWTCSKWQRTSRGYRESISATFEQVFDL